MGSRRSRTMIGTAFRSVCPCLITTSGEARQDRAGFCPPCPFAKRAQARFALSGRSMVPQRGAQTPSEAFCGLQRGIRGYGGACTPIMALKRRGGAQTGIWRARAHRMRGDPSSAASVPRVAPSAPQVRKRHRDPSENPCPTHEKMPTDFGGMCLRHKIYGRWATDTRFFKTAGRRFAPFFSSFS